MTHSPHRHLAIFIPDLSGGGAERVMVTLANRFAAMGHRVDLVLASATGTYMNEIGPGVRVVDLKSGRMLTSLFPLVRYLRGERPDAMLSAMHHVNIIAILARKLARVAVRLVVSERNSLANLQSVNGRIMRFLMGFLYPSADAVIAVTQAGARELVSEFNLERQKVYAIPNPLDIERVKFLASEPLCHPWFFAGEPPVILAVGRLAPQKDFSTLIEAFAQLRMHRPARLVILGEGPLREDLERLVQEKGLSDVVSMPGFQENPFKWMARCDLFVLSSRFEGFPNVLVQALACGARVVSTNCPTGPEEILEGEGLVPIGDQKELARSMASALNDKNKVNKGLVSDKYSSEDVANRYEEILLDNIVFKA